MLVRPFLAVGVLAVALSSSDLHATDIVVPTWPRIFAQAQGRYAFKIVPKRQTGENEGVFFSLDEDGKANVIWRRNLVDRPGRAIVVDNGKHVITVDERDDEHSLVIYGEGGKVLADFKLQDLLTAQEIAKLPVLGGPVRCWDKGITEFDDRSWEDELVLRIKHKAWSKVIRVSLSSGRIIPNDP